MGLELHAGTINQVQVRAVSTAHAFGRNNLVIAQPGLND